MAEDKKGIPDRSEENVDPRVRGVSDQPERREEQEEPQKKGPVKKIRAKTRARAEAARTAPEIDRVKHKLDKFFKWAVLVSFLAHSPILFGRTDKDGNRHWNLGFIDFGGTGSGMVHGPDEANSEKLKEKLKDETPPEWEKEVREDLIKELGVDDAEKLIGEIDPEALAGFKKAEEAIKQRKAERAGRIDHSKFDEYKKNLLERLEKGEKVSFRDFVFEVELLGLGIDPKDIEKAKTVFLEEMQVLDQGKPAVPTREFLQKVVGLTEKDEKNDAYEPTRTSLAEYLVRKKEGKRGNCKARGKYQAMALEYLYPDRRKDILLQKSGDHIRALFTVDENLYVMEPGVAILKKDDLKGKITFTLDEYMLSTAGKKIVKHVDEVAEEKPKADLPTINDDTAFKEPEADGRLKMDSNNHQFLYKEKFAPTETQKMKLPPSSKMVHEENERIRREVEYEEMKKRMDEENAKYNRHLERSKKTGEGPVTPPNPFEIGEVAEWVVVLNEDKQLGPQGEWREEDMEEILPWKQKDYPDIELSDRIQWNRFNGGRMAFGHGNVVREVPGLTNPSPETIKKINSFAVETVVYHDHAIYGQATWSEIFNTSIPHVEIDLGSARLSLGFKHLLASKKGESARKYRGELALTVEPHVDTDASGLDSSGSKATNSAERRKNDQPYSEFPEDEFRLLLQGEGGLRLKYPERDFSEKEIEMIAQSSRPYVFVDGVVCNYESKALAKMKESKKTVLVLSDRVYFEVMHRMPELLLEPHIKTEHEYFQQGQYLMNGPHTLLNAYTLRESLNRLAGGNTPGASAELAKLNQLIQLMEEKFMNPYVNVPATGQAELDRLQKSARDHFQNTMDDGPIGCMGVCPPPDGMASSSYVESNGVIEKYNKPTETQSGISLGLEGTRIWTKNSADGTKTYRISSPAPGAYTLDTFSGTTQIGATKTILKDPSVGFYYTNNANGQSFRLETELQTIFTELENQRNQQ